MALCDRETTIAWGGGVTLQVTCTNSEHGPKEPHQWYGIKVTPDGQQVVGTFLWPNEGQRH